MFYYYFQIIDVEKTTAHMYGTKVEITMPKAEPGSWAKLDFPREKLPPPVKAGQSPPQKLKTTEDADSDDEFNLDDIESVTQGVTLTELASTKPDLD